MGHGSSHAGHGLALSGHAASDFLRVDLGVGVVHLFDLCFLCCILLQTFKPLKALQLRKGRESMANGFSPSAVWERSFKSLALLKL